VHERSPARVQVLAAACKHMSAATHYHRCGKVVIY
jgi:hypothetical protein